MEKAYNLDLVRSLTRNNKSLIEKILGLCIEQLPASVQKMQQSNSIGDFDTLLKEIHYIRPVLGYFSLTELENECHNISLIAACRESSVAINDAIQRLEKSIDLVILEMKKDQEAALNRQPAFS